VAALSDRSKLFTESSLISAFRYFDANSSGFLEKEELRAALKLAEGR
jgi:Ca2+-binding EF-hand superfamily protein